MDSTASTYNIYGRIVVALGVFAGLGEAAK
jgi:hypothetical protein